MSLDAYTRSWLKEYAEANPRPPAPRTATQISRYENSLQTVAKAFSELAEAKQLELLEIVLIEDSRSSFGDNLYPEIAAACALLAGTPGVEMLVKVAKEGDYASESQSAVQALWLAGSGKTLPDGYVGSIPGMELRPNGAVQAAAKVAFDDLIAASKENLTLFSKLVSIANLESIRNQVDGGHNEFSEYLMKVFSTGSIAVSSAVLDEFSALVAQDLTEERYQEFLKANPIILDPLAAEVVPKHRLGSDYITDFVIRRHDGRYLVVEIEKPQDRIFNGNSDFTSAFSHAMGQVLDFQGWVAENSPYARSKLPNIEHPRGLLVMGRRSSLTTKQEDKLRRWCANSNWIEVATYDDLVISGRQLILSLRSYTTSS